MTVGTPARLIASCFGLAGFAVAVVAGMAAGNDSGRILTVALCGMVFCHILGLGAGMIGERMIDQYMEQYRASRPDVGGPPPHAGPSVPGGAA